MRTASLLSLALVPSLATADVLSSFDRFLGDSRPDYDPTQLEAREVDSGRDFAPFSPGDSDLGVQEILGEYKGLPPVRAELSTGLYWTDNAPAATRQLDDESWFWTARAAVSWQPRIGPGWFADLGLDASLFEFDDSNANDFQNYVVYAGVVKLLPDLHDLLLFGRFEYQFLNFDNGGTFLLGNDDYSAARVRVGAQKVLFNTPHHHLAAGISAAFDLTADDSTLERNEYALDVHYTWFIQDNLSATLSYRGAFWDFDSPTGVIPFYTEDRQDFNQVVGLELAYHPCKNSKLYTSIFFSDSNSNTPFGANDSQAWTAGLGVGAVFEF